jgi:hypothetical protein
MYSIIASGWEESHTDISKAALGRFAQCIDLDETITYRYNSTNLHILLHEIAVVAALTRERPKSSARLRQLLAEALDKKVSSSAVNDPVAATRFPNVIERLEAWSNLVNAGEDKLAANLKVVENDAAGLATEVGEKYLEVLLDELRQVEWKDIAKFERNAKQSFRLVESLVPELLYMGFSLARLKQLVNEMVALPLPDFLSPVEALRGQSLQKEFSLHILADGCPSSLALELEANSSELIDTDTGKMYQTWEFTAVGPDVVSAASSRLLSATRSLHLKQIGIPAYDIWHLVKDKLQIPHHEGGFESVADEFNGDPHLLGSRQISLNKCINRFDLDISRLQPNTYKVLDEALFLYNSGVFTNSIENSFMLLWTCLESLMGLRSENDITTIKRNLTPFFAMNWLSRRVYSLSELIRQAEDLKLITELTWPPKLSVTEKSFCEWATWMCQQYPPEKDPYELLKTEPLISYHFVHHGKQIRKLGDLRSSMMASQQNLEYQMERLYLTRNRIVHSGLYDEHFDELWPHLEYYCSRVLAAAILSLEQNSGDAVTFRDAFFSKIRMQFDSTCIYLDKRRDKVVNSVDLANSKVFSYLSGGL